MGHSRKNLDLTGQRFGKLTVQAPAENVGNRTAWRCQCACGGEAVVTTRHLRDGHVSSCGCVPAGVSGLTYVDGTCVEMLRAKTVRKNNTSGVPGVDWRAERNSWRATICFKGRRHYLGCYKDFGDAVRARQEAEAHYFGSFLQEFTAASAGEAGAGPDSGD